MRRLIILIIFLYLSPAVAVDNVLLNSVLLTSDKKNYDKPNLSILDFKKLVDKLALCEANTTSKFIEIGDNLLKIQYENRDSIWGKGGISEFSISFMKHEEGYYAYLQTHDRGVEHIWDEDRFIPSSEIVDLVRIMANNCDKQPYD